MKEKLKKLRERLVNKMRIYRFRMEDFIDRLFGRIMVRDAFYLLDELEECPPEDEHSPQLQLGYAIIYMTDKEFENYRTRLRRIKEFCHNSSESNRLRCYESEEELAEQRERFHNYPF